MGTDEMRGFGYKVGWFAVRDGSADEVFSVLGCRSVGPVGWREGVERAYADMDVVVATPALMDGWMLVMGWWVAARAEHLDVAALSVALGCEVQLFVSHRVVDLHRWERAVSGALVRSFEYLGERGEVTRWHGTPCEVEREVGLPPTASLGDYVGVGEEDVMRVAAAWSVDPTSLDGRPATGPLLLGQFPPRQRDRTPVTRVVDVTDLIINARSAGDLDERIEQRVRGRGVHE